MDDSNKAAMEQFRDDFPMLKTVIEGRPLVYLDSGATAHKPNCVIDAEADFYRHKYGTVHRAVYQLAQHSTAAYHAVRERSAEFLNAASPYEIVFTRGTTESINLVASCYGRKFLKAGDEVVVTEIEHHANIVSWQMICEETGAKLRVVPVDDDGEIDLEAYGKLLGDKTKVVAITHISNAIGTVVPVKEMCRQAKEHGAVTLVDGAQAVPHLQVDVQDIGCDFYVFSGHKIYGPTGVGVLYGKKEQLEAMPPYQGGGDMIETVTFEKTTYNRAPLKFEAGTPMIAQVVGLGVALDYIDGIGLDRIAAYEHQLLVYATEKLKALDGVRIIGNAKRKGAIISFVVDGIHPLDLGSFLDIKGIAVRTGHHCAQPTMQRYGVTATTRASFALYNTLEEVDCFVKAVADGIETLR